MSAKARQKARDLIRLATNEKTPEKERIVASVQAVALIEKHDLLESPLDDLIGADNETIKAAGTLLNLVSDPQVVNSVKKLWNKRKRS